MALAELVLMPLVGQWADHAPRRSVIITGTLGGTLFFVALSLGGGAWTVLLAFPAVALMVSAIYGVGIGYVQELDPRHAGLGGGIFFAAQGIGMALGGPTIAWAEHVLGLPLAFAVPALAIASGALVVIGTHPRSHPLATDAAPA
jgi:MFS family permease